MTNQKSMVPVWKDISAEFQQSNKTDCRLSLEKAGWGQGVKSDEVWGRSRRGQGSKQMRSGVRADEEVRGDSDHLGMFHNIVCCLLVSGGEQFVCLFRRHSVTCTVSVTYWPVSSFRNCGHGRKSDFWTSTRSICDGASVKKMHSLRGIRWKKSCILLFLCIVLYSKFRDFLANQFSVVEKLFQIGFQFYWPWNLNF